MASDFRELRVWQAAMSLTETIYVLSKSFPADERFWLTSQMRRAVVSVASCIAEGNARDSSREYLRYLSMAAGSLAEVETQVLLSGRLGFATDGDVQPALESIRSVAKQLQALKNAIGAKVVEAHPFPVPRFPFPA